MDVCPGVERTDTWDRDGDGISDDVERHPPNRELGLSPARCDADPSRAEREYNDGWLTSGFNLPREGTGYATIGQEDEWGTAYLLRCVEAVGRELPLHREMTLGRLSKARGGAIDGYWSHQNGLEVEVRYVRSDDRAQPLDFRKDDPAKVYDRSATQQLFELFLEQCEATVIAAHPAAFDDRAAPGTLQPRAEFAQFFHVTLPKPGAGAPAP